MSVRFLLRVEGAAVAVLAVAAFLSLDGPWWLFLALILAPDLGMLGYLANPRVGSWTYNALHTYLGPLAAGAAGVATGTDLAVLAALVWVVHIGADRALAYGLKRPTGFSDTHLDA